MRLPMRLAIVAAVSALILVGCSKRESNEGEVVEAVSSQQDGGIQDLTAAVTVNGRVVTNQDVADEQETMMQQLSGRVDPQRLSMMKDAMKQQAMDNIINRILLDQALDKEGIEAEPGEADQRISRIRSDFDSDEEFDAWLASMGIDEQRLASEMETSLRVEKLLEKRGQDISQPSESEVRAFYDENPDEFTEAEQVRASHILLKVDPDATQAEKDSRRQEAVEMLAEVKQGKDFAQMASAHSDCPSKERGGDLGFFERGQMVKPFEDAAFALKPGEISDVVETRYGYHIIKVTDRKEGRTIPYEESRDSIINYLSGQKKQSALASLTEDLRGSATIEYAEKPPQEQ